ncbi:MAG: 4-(cytidine 5'-diphospho)-2-C-methyl-D-erythritol kinase, partial [Chlamydiia bacterium]|nr:4-(cytidine 5'-diphospho)-2-C-methyl-D-erythritol kinase [Chlamydiia bacterium]
MLLKLKAPAKVNLFLRVLGKRGDGYHEIATVMQAIDLCDRLTFSLAEADTLTCTDPAVPTNSSNLILRALHLFRQKSGKQLSLQIHLEKKIPMQAGLGGGSSDAAATLFACNALTGNTIPTDTLQTWSQEIGSDIPFFYSSGTAYCTGRGEVVKPLSPLSLPPIAIHKPPFGLSTPAIFSAYTASDDRCP